MKKLIIENRYEGEDSVDDRTILKSPLENQVPDQRNQVTPKELRKITKICDKIDNGKEIDNDKVKKIKKYELLLEDDEYNYVKSKFNSYGNWIAREEARKQILRVADAIDNAEEYKVK